MTEADTSCSGHLYGRVTGLEIGCTSMNSGTVVFLFFIPFMMHPVEPGCDSGCQIGLSTSAARQVQMVVFISVGCNTLIDVAA